MEKQKSRFIRRRKILGICDYCGSIAYYHFKTGKKSYCCKKYISQCPAVKEINSNFHRGPNWKPKPQDSEVPFCECELKCKSKVKWNKNKNCWNKYINGHGLKGDKNPSKRPEVIEKISKAQKGKPRPYMQGKKVSKKTCKKISIRILALRDKHPMKNPETVKKVSETLRALGDKHPSRRPEQREAKSKLMIGNQYLKGFKHTQEFCNNQSEIMLNGGAARANSFVQNPSKPQVELFELTKQIYPAAILNYPSLNKSIDIAIPDLMIAIEYDGSYWHKDQVADNKRQKELENIGWQFLRYTDYVPVIDELKRDLNQINK